MLDRHRGHTLAELGILVWLCALASGCQTSPLTAALQKEQPVVRGANPAPDRLPAPEMTLPPSTSEHRPDLAKTLKLTPGTVLIWSAEPMHGTPAPPFHGQSRVEADGKVNLGPYGRLSVAGLTTSEASREIANHLAHYMKSPHVHLTAAFPAGTANRAQGAGIREQGPAIGRSAPADAAPAPAALPPVPPAPRPPLPPAVNTITPVGWNTTPASMEAPRPPGVSPAAAWQASPTGGDAPTPPPSPGLGAFLPPAGSEVHTIAPGGAEIIAPASAQFSQPLPQGPPLEEKPTGPTATVADEKSDHADKKPEEAPPPKPYNSEGNAANGSGASAAPAGPPGPPGPPCAHTPCPPGGCGQTPQEMKKISLPPYVIEPPDILLVESTQYLRDQPVYGQHLVRPDGTISLGIYGCVYVNGMTLDQARLAVAAKLAERVKDVDPRNVVVDVFAYNSKVFYVITDGAGNGEQVYRIPITGSETVMDAIGQIGGLSPVSSKCNIWVARRGVGHNGPQILPVDWIAVSQGGQTDTNYQIYPGDRLYVQSDIFRRINTALDKFLTPIERVMGTILLGSTVVNSIKGTSGFGGVR
jgi:polysaccharide export outer membrane protein